MLVHLHEGLPRLVLLHDRVVQLDGAPCCEGYAKPAFMNDGEGDVGIAERGPVEVCAFGAVVATCGLVFGPHGPVTRPRGRR